MLDAVAPLRFRGHDMIVFHVLDPAEIEFAYDDASAFEDLESGEQMPVVPEALAEQYRALVREHSDALRSEVLRAAHRLRAAQHARRRSTTRCSATCRCANRCAGQVDGISSRRSFSLGLGALAIPVLIHLIQRERKRVVEFPSLMFLRRIPYQSVRRRRIRDWLLLAMRLAALALIVLGVRAAVLPARLAGRGGAERRARGGHPGRHVLQHGLRRPLAEGAGRGARRDQRARRRATARRSCSSRRAPKSPSAPPATSGRLDVGARRRARSAPARRATRRR